MPYVTNACSFFLDFCEFTEGCFDVTSCADEYLLADAAAYVSAETAASGNPTDSIPSNRHTLSPSANVSTMHRCVILFSLVRNI